MVSPMSFQVSSKGVMINLNPDVMFEDLKASMLKHVEEASDFFSGVDIYLNIYGCTLTLEQINEIINIVSKYEKVNKIYFANEFNSNNKSEVQIKDTVMIRGTIRSGQRIKYPTNILVMGDINPGAEVIAGGDIIVLGKLRGVVHAGAGGIYNARVIALKFQPTQLRIANIISRPPDDDEYFNDIKPEKAYIKGNSIVVERLII